VAFRFRRKSGDTNALAPSQRGAANRALIVVTFLLIAGMAGAVYWLSSSYDPYRELAVPLAVVDLAAKPDDGTEATAPMTPPPVESPAATPLPTPAQTAEEPEKTAPDSLHGEAKPEPEKQDTAVAAPPPPAAHDDAEKPAAPAREADTGQGKDDAGAEKTAAATAMPKPASSRRATDLTPATDPALIEQTKNGPVPIIGPDGRTPLQAYSRPHPESGRPRIAIVLGSLGLSRPATIAAIQQLPGPITLSFAPYGRNLQDFVDQARAAGHEVLLQVPMEPIDYPKNDPGPHTLLTSLSARKNLERLDWLLARFTGYVGIVNYMGSRYTASEPHLRPLMTALRERGLMFVDARSTSASVAAKTAVEIGLPVVSNDRFIDNEASRSNIDARLGELERIARSRGQAVGIGFPYPVTIERLSQWARGLEAKGIDLAPVSALLVSEHKPG
jgi:polysaccharide deacetylase 2 family uncharacterized protein YibQ